MSLDVEPLEGLRVRATFSDGAVKEIDLSEVLGKIPVRPDPRAP